MAPGSGRASWHGIAVAAVEAALRQAEQTTSGEIRVAVARWYFWGNLRRTAERAFVRLGMASTRGRTGVLIFVSPRRRQFCVLGDVGIHQKVGDAFWESAVAVMATAARSGGITQGLLRGIETVAGVLVLHFPSEGASNPNELPDEVSFDDRKSRTT